MNKLRYLVFFVLILVLLGCGKSGQITLGKNNFCIPEKYNLLNQTNSAVINIPSSDKVSGGSFQVAILPEYVKNSIPDYKLMHGSLPSSLLINVRNASGDDLVDVSLSKSKLNILRLEGKYEKSETEFDSSNDYYRVNALPGNPPFLIWHVLSKKPDPNYEIPSKLSDYYVAYCSRAGGVAGGSSTCEYFVGINDYLVKVITTENNLRLKDAITAYVEAELSKWQKSCK